MEEAKEFNLGMRLTDFDYELPENLIAQFPLEKRDASRLMVLKRDTGRIEEDHFYNIGRYLIPGDLLILNDTRVFPARLSGRKESGGKTEILLLKALNRGNEWRCLVKKSKRIKSGSRIIFSKDLEGIVKERCGDGTCVIEFNHNSSLMETIKEIGRTPLPPYIKRSSGDAEFMDRERYQTVYARNQGAVAAPTAGLHFTESLLNSLRKKGIQVESLTLHVGWGTFKPVRVMNVENHSLPPERYNIPSGVVEEVKKAKGEGRRVVAVGTTTTRALEGAFKEWDNPELEGETSLFILPGYRFKVVDALITNFHLPRSTLLMLVSAFAGRDLIAEAYKKAIAQGYRFYSYGDAMLIL